MFAKVWFVRVLAPRFWPGSDIFEVRDLEVRCIGVGRYGGMVVVESAPILVGCTREVCPRWEV